MEKSIDLNWKIFFLFTVIMEKNCLKPKMTQWMM